MENELSREQIEEIMADRSVNEVCSADEFARLCRMAIAYLDAKADAVLPSGALRRTVDNMRLVASSWDDEVHAHKRKSLEAFALEVERIIEPSDGCQWIDEGDYWQTKCGESFCIEAGSPQDNGMKFCCYCGNTIDADQARGAANGQD